MDLDLEISTAKEGQEWFYPDLGRNLDLPEEQRAGILCKLLNGRELRKAEKGALSKVKLTNARTVARKIDDATDRSRRQIVESNVIDLKNWFAIVNGDATKTEIKDIRVLIDFIERKWPNAIEGGAFVDSIYSFIVGASRIEDELLGESNSLPASA